MTEEKNYNLDELHTNIKQALPSEPVKVPPQTGKKVVIVSILLALYALGVIGVFFGSGGFRLVSLLYLVLFVFFCRPILSGLRKLFKVVSPGD